jgi:hypothetical protein
MYRIRFAAPQVHIIEELGRSKFPPEERGRGLQRHRKISSSVGSGKPVPAANEVPAIDVMVLYSAAAVAFSNGTDSITSIINQAVDDANVSYAASGINQTITDVYAGEITYVEKADIDEDLDALKSNAEAHDLRCKYAADIVVLITKPSLEAESCGTAYQMNGVSAAYRDYAFAVVPVNCATAVYSFPHELGHVMGADHNEAAGTSDPPYPYSRGYEAPNKAWHTIMASTTVACTTNSCPPRILYWSNPLISYLSVPTGVGESAENPANNALTLNNTASTVASFYPYAADCP